jgi:hypothetical protein
LAKSEELPEPYFPLRSAWPLRLAPADGKQGQGLHVPGGNFTRWPVKGMGSAMAKKLGHNTLAHVAPEVCVF